MLFYSPVFQYFVPSGTWIHTFKAYCNVFMYLVANNYLFLGRLFHDLKFSCFTDIFLWRIQHVRKFIVIKGEGLGIGYVLCAFYIIYGMILVSMKTFSVQAVLIWRRRRDGFQENPEGTEGLAEGPSYCLQCWFILISFWFPSSCNFFSPCNSDFVVANELLC